jgi:hypothetical protein
MPDENGPDGLGVDAQGNPVRDPTKNVLDLVEAAIQRQDDLRDVETRHAREVAEIRAECARELRISETKRIDAVARVRASYEDKLRKAETARIDAIRAVDVAAVQRAADVQSEAAQALATQVQTSAEAMRAQVAATAGASATALASALQPIQTRLDDLTRAQYEAKGQKAQVVETSEATAGRRSGQGLVVGIAVGAATLFLGLLGVIAALVNSGPG